MTIRETLERMMHEARRDNRPMTHWLMTHGAYDQFRYEVRAMTFTVADPGKQPEYNGLPIYFTREPLEDPGVLLRDGEPPDDAREEELRRRLVAVQRDYQDRSRPIIEELAKMEARKPPLPPRFIVPSNLRDVIFGGDKGGQTPEKGGTA